ncbi:MAG: MFS transporter [Niabella sp.]
MNYSYKQVFCLPVIVAALGYFVDIYDLLLFSIVRVNSLTDLGYAGTELMDQGIVLINMQMAGMLVGGILWGVLGDKKGRLSVLFGSILLYSLANLGNGFVQTAGQYAILRFIAGVGLAGELGAGITLVAEILPKEIRGYGTSLVAAFGLLGAVLANIMAELFDWRTAYFIGGGLGLVLLLLRVSIKESGIYKKIKASSHQKGNFLSLFNNRKRLYKYIRCILIGLPIWFVIGILMTFSPEIAAARGIEYVVAGKAVMYGYIGLSSGDIMSGLLSQYLRSRKKAAAVFIVLTGLALATYLYYPWQSYNGIYACCGLLGFSIGYWALFVTIAAEQFGSNLRATVATTVPNFIRATVVPLSFVFLYLTNKTNLITAAVITGAATILIAIIALFFMEETFTRSLDFVEDMKSDKISRGHNEQKL